MKPISISRTEANLIQVALTHTYEEYEFLTKFQIEDCQNLIEKLDSILNHPNKKSYLDFKLTSKEKVLIGVSVSKWYQEYKNEESDEYFDLDNVKLDAIGVIHTIINH
tara:strand:- start:194 stop:517 length:324 start_codon:yes stop_codon:yes gene_type:complete